MHGSVCIKVAMAGLVSFSFLFSSCAGLQPNRSINTDQESSDEVAESKEVFTENDESTELQTLSGIPIEKNKHVEKWIEYFAIKDRERFHRFLKRGNSYRQVVENILEENGVPAELYFLAMIESGYQPRATSTAKAGGVWQFMPATARRYGLQFDHYVDERRDPIRATEAAAKYLRDLYNIFGSWHLALAAYNSGEYRVLNGIVKGKSRDFWELHRKKVLPPETREYVPKFIAAVIIGQNPEEHGFTDIQVEQYPSLEAVEVPSPLSLAVVSNVSGVSIDKLKQVNPHLRRGITPPSGKTYELWVPSEHAKKLSNQQLASYVIKGVKARALASVDNSNKHYYRVKGGDTLASIARAHSTTIIHLKEINSLKTNRILRGQRLRLSAKSFDPKRQHRYRVQSGDSLYSISSKFHISVPRLKKLNSLRTNRIVAGQSLRVGG